MCLPFLVITFSCRHPSTEKRTMPHHSCQRALLPVDDDTKQWKPSLKRTLDEWLPAGHEERFRGAGKGKLELTARHLGPGRLRGSSPIERVFPLSVMPVGLNASAFSFSHPQRRPSPTAFPCDKEPRGTRPSHRPQSAHRARGGKGDGETRPDDLAASALPQRHQADSQRGAAKSACEGRLSLSDSCRALQHLAGESHCATAGWSPWARPRHPAEEAGEVGEVGEVGSV